MSATTPQAISDATGTDESAVAQAASIKSVYVYQAPVRVWHWVNALSLVVLCLTGYFIGSPLPTQPGEASANYLMGYIRFAHFSAGYVFAVGLLGRLYWAFVGNHHARELFTLPVFNAAYWREVITMLKWYAFLIPRPSRYVGHNPLARAAMFFGFLVITLFMIATGFALGCNPFAGSATRGLRLVDSICTRGIPRSAFDELPVGRCTALRRAARRRNGKRAWLRPARP